MCVPKFGIKNVLSWVFLILVMNISCQRDLGFDTFASNTDLTRAFGLRIEQTIRQSEEQLKTDLQQALEFALKSVELSDRYPDDTYYFDTRNNVAKVCYFIGLYHEAAVYWNTCLNYAESKGDELQAAISCFNLSALSIVIQEYTYAEYYLNRAKPYFKEHVSDNPLFVSYSVRIDNNFGILHSKRGRMELAEAHFKNALNTITAYNLDSDRITLYNAYTTFLIDLEQFDKAEALLEETLQLNADIQNLQTEATVLFKLARIHEAKGDTIRMAAALRRGYEVSIAVSSTSLMREFAANLFQYEKSRSNLPAALRYAEVRDSLDFEDQRDEAKRLLIVRDLESMHAAYKAEISLMKKRSRFGVSASILLFMLFGLGLTILLFAYKSRTKENRVKQKQAEVYRREVDLASRQLEEELKRNQKELMARTVNEMKRTEAIKALVSSVAVNPEQPTPLSVPNNAEIILEKVERIYQSETSKEFELRFKDVEDSFYERLMERYPELTLNERRLCAFLKLDMSTKDIIQITGQSIRAVEIARTRLRKKLGISHSDISLNAFIQRM